MMKILFVCEGNVNRSQMAGTMLKSFIPYADVQTAGTIADKAGKLVSDVTNDGVVAMREIGFDMRSNTITKLTQKMVEDADTVILIKPILGGPIPEYLKNSPKFEIWTVPDPGYKQITYDGARDMILKKVKYLVFRVRLYRYLALGFGIVLILVAATNALIYTETKKYIYDDVKNAPDATVALIPGAPVFSSGVISSIYVDRANTAISLYETGKVRKILVSGDNSSVSHNEVDPVRKYLMLNGIPDADIFLDHAGFDTYSSMYRARDIFGVKSLIIATQSFHLPRAVFIARRLGMEAYGVRSDVGSVLFSNYIREILAGEKAVIDLITHRTPKYLGDRIPITGDKVITNY
jgi:SanA protein